MKMLIGVFLISTISWSQNTIVQDSCDVLVMKDSTKLFVNIIELTATEIYYKNCSTDSVNNSGKWIKRNVLSEVIIRHEELQRNNQEIRYNVQPALAEIGFSFNIFPSDWQIYNIAGELRIRINESNNIRHYIYSRLGFLHYIADSKPLTTYTNLTPSLGYHAELKKGKSRLRFSYGGAFEFNQINKDQSKYISPYGTVYPATKHIYHQFSIVARVGIKYYLSQYCQLQLSFSGGLGSPYYEGSSVYSSNWFSFVSSQLPSLALFGRIPASK